MNTMLFDNWKREDGRMISSILLNIKEYKGTGKEEKVEYILNPVFFDEKPIGFFDGAVVNDKCGAGIYIKISAHHGYKAFFVRGKSNSMKAEILGLWGLLLLHINFP
jgi:hypothetical protein